MEVAYNPNGIPILGYHGLYDGRKQEKGDPWWTKTDDFLGHLQYLWTKEYSPIFFSELIGHFLVTPRNKWKAAKPIVITFDDGHSCLFDKLIRNASFDLQSMRFKATVFVIVGSVSEDANHRIYSENGFGYLTKPEIQKMAETSSFEFASHSMSHPSLLRLLNTQQIQEIRREVAGSRNELINLLNGLGIGSSFSNTFAYPFGENHFSPQLIDYVKEGSYDCAVDFNQQPTVNNGKTDRYRLRRISMTYRQPGWVADYNVKKKLIDALKQSPAA